MIRCFLAIQSATHQLQMHCFDVKDFMKSKSTRRIWVGAKWVQSKKHGFNQGFFEARFRAFDLSPKCRRYASRMISLLVTRLSFGYMRIQSR